MTIFLLVIFAFLLDLILGEPKRYHPLVGFGSMASTLEAKFNPKEKQTDQVQILVGALALIILLAIVVLPLTWFVSLFEGIGILDLVLTVVVLYFCIAYRSLKEHVQAIASALESDDLRGAREAVGRIVSRDTDNMNEQQVASAGIESALENASDAVFASVFWFVIAGLPGVLIYRVVNTLDAMWGYRTDRYNYFGRAAAKLDDAMNYIPARLTAFSFATLGKRELAFQCWREQASGWKSPNAGVVMATGAGALALELGGAATYHNTLEQRPVLGKGDKPIPSDISRALELIRRSLILWLLIVFVFSVIG